MSDREFLPGQVRLLEELGRRGRLLASSGNPPEDERLARRAAAGDVAAARRLESRRRAARADRLPAAEREYLRHVGEVLLTTHVVVSENGIEMGHEEIDLRRPIRVRVLGESRTEDGKFVGARIEEFDDRVAADWPVVLLDEVGPEDVLEASGRPARGPTEGEALLFAGDLFPGGSGVLWVYADSDQPRSWRKA